MATKGQSNNPKINIEMGVDASGVKDGTKVAKDSINELSQALDQQSKKATESFNKTQEAADQTGVGIKKVIQEQKKLAEEAEKVAKRQERATNSIIAAVQRSTAELEAGGKGTAAYQQKIAEQRGADITKLEPYLAKLREIEKANESVNGSLGKGNKQLNEFGMTAKATAAALRQVPAQFTDIVVSLQGGQAPLTVLLQQGGQLKDIFGTAGAAARALGGYIAGLVNPFTLAAAAVGVLGYGYFKGSAEAEAFQKSLILTGNAAGVTAGQLSTIAASLDKGSTTQAQAAEVLNLFAQSGKIGAENFQRFAKAAIDFEKVGGGAVADIAKNFEALGKSPLQASLKLTESTNYLTRSVYAQIKALEEQGKSTEAAKVAQEAYAASLEGMTPKLLKNLGYVERAWLGIKGAVNQTLDAINEVGRETTPGQQLEQMKQKLANAQELQLKAAARGQVIAGDSPQIAIYKEQIRLLQQSVDLEIQRADAKKDGIKAEAAAFDLGEKAKSFYSDEKKREIERAQADATKEKALAGLTKGSEEYNAVLRDYNTIIAGINRGAGKEYADSINSQISAVQARIKTETEMLNRLKEREKFAAKLTEGEREYERVSEQMRNAKSAGEKKLLENLAVEYKNLGEVQKQIQNETITANAKESLANAKDIAKVYEDELRLTGLTALERQKIVAARAIDLKYAKQLREIEASSKKPEEKKADIAIIDEAKAIEKSAAVNKVIQDDFAKTSEQISQSLTDALMRGFESGKDFGTNFKTTLENMFKTMILRPTIQAIVAPIGGGVMSLFSAGAQAAGGASGGAAGGASGFSSALSTYQMLSGIKTVLTDGVATAIAQGFGTVAGSAAGQQLGLATAEAATSSTAASYSLTTTGLAAQTAITVAGNAIAAYAVQKALSGDYKVGNGKIVDAATLVGSYFIGPLAGVVGGIVNRAFGMGSVNTTASGISGTLSTTGGADVQNFQNWSQRGGWFRSGRSGTNFSAVTSEFDTFLDSTVKNIAESTRNYAESIGLSASVVDSFSKAINISLMGLDDAGKTKAIQDALGSFAEDLAKTIVDRTKTVFLDGSEILVQRSGETATQTLMRLSESISTVNGVLKLFNDDLLSLSVRSSVAASSLIDVFGGVENFRNQTSAYYEAFFSDLEKNAQVAKALQEGFGSIGLSVPKTVDQYKKLVNAQDLTAESGQKTFAALIALAPAFDAITKSAASLQSNYNQYLLDPAAQQRAVMDGLSQSFSAILPTNLPSSIQEYKRLVDAQDATTEAGKRQRDGLLALVPQFAAYLDSIKQAQDAIDSQRYGLETTLLGLQGNTVALRDRERSALDETNRALYDKITALQDANAAQQAADQAAAARKQAEDAVINERAGLDKQLLQLQGNTAALRELERASLNGTNRALYDQIKALEDSKTAAQAAAQAEQTLTDERNRVAQERQGLEMQILQETGNVAEIRKLELASLDQSNRALQERIFALQDEKTVTEEQNRIAQERKGLENQLLQEMGNTAAIREIELASLAQSNRALQERIWALQDEKAAQEELKQASQGAVSEIQRLKESLGGGAQSNNAAFLQAQFATTTAQARAGDLSALSRLPAISSALDQAFELTATTANDVARMKGFLVGSLTETLAVVGAGSLVSSNSNSVDSLELTPTSSTAGLMSGASSTALLIEEISALRVDNQAQARAIVQLQSRFTKVVERWDIDGIPETRAVV